jgi:hypothetical protein
MLLCYFLGEVNLLPHLLVAEYDLIVEWPVIDTHEVSHPLIGKRARISHINDISLYLMLYARNMPKETRGRFGIPRRNDLAVVYELKK